MRYFLDTEFIEDGKTIELISIGIVAEDGRRYYAINSECDYSKANDWVKENVLTQLGTDSRDTRARIKEHILDFCSREQYGKPEFWGYYADYDWVVFCWLFGAMIDLPPGWPMYCRDLKQLCDDLGNPDLPKQGAGEHNALADALWNQQTYGFLQTLKGGE
jgi:hypothetical protein